MMVLYLRDRNPNHPTDSTPPPPYVARVNHMTPLRDLLPTCLWDHVPGHKVEGLDGLGPRG